MCVLSCSVMCDSVTPWAVACHAPLSWDSPGRNTGVSCHALLQGIFLTQGLNPHWQVGGSSFFYTEFNFIVLYFIFLLFEVWL